MSNEINPVSGKIVKKASYRDPMSRLNDEEFMPAPVQGEKMKVEAIDPAPKKCSSKKVSDGFAVPQLAPEKKNTAKRSTVLWDKDTLEAVENWLSEHPGHTITSMIYCGMKSIGVDVADELLVPARPRRRKRKNAK